MYGGAECEMHEMEQKPTKETQHTNRRRIVTDYSGDPFASFFVDYVCLAGPSLQ